MKTGDRLAACRTFSKEEFTVLSSPFTVVVVSNPLQRLFVPFHVVSGQLFHFAPK
jgi:hypothetical protein